MSLDMNNVLLEALKNGTNQLHCVIFGKVLLMAEWWKERDWLGIASFGFFLILVGVIWLITPNLRDEIVTFAEDIAHHTEPITENVSLPAPASPHPVVYTAAAHFCLVFGVFHIIVLGLRTVFKESLNRKSGTVSSVVFWLGASYFLFALADGNIGWFAFLAGLIMIVGLMIVVSSLIKLLFLKYKP